MKRLIVNADDFGMTQGVNRAIIELSRRGSLSSTTLMACGPYAEEAAALARNQPTLGVGCHIVLVDGAPILSPAELPTLVDRNTGRFRSTLGSFVLDLLRGRIRAEEIEAEAEAQMIRIRSLGLAPTHVDTHKHTHMFAKVLAPLLRAAERQKIGAIRNPFEPGWSVTATHGAPLLRRVQVHLLALQLPAFRGMVAHSGLATTDGAVGVLATGTLDSATIHALLRAMPDGMDRTHKTWELVTHPGYNDAQLASAGTRLLASRETEVHALASAAFDDDVDIVSFRQLSSL